MKLKDKRLSVFVNVYDRGCLKKPCYWPRKDPGSFTPGKGYSARSDDWLCGTREAKGCPD